MAFSWYHGLQHYFTTHVITDISLGDILHLPVPVILPKILVFIETSGPMLKVGCCCKLLLYQSDFICMDVETWFVHRSIVALVQGHGSMYHCEMPLYVLC